MKGNRLKKDSVTLHAEIFLFFTDKLKKFCFKHNTPICAINQVNSPKSVSLWKKHSLESQAAVAESVHQTTLHFHLPGASRSSVLSREGNHAA